jgi:DNA uptake protein ComE-like DNA-binding protein
MTPKVANFEQTSELAWTILQYMRRRASPALADVNFRLRRPPPVSPWLADIFPIEEVPMTNRVRVNLANARELLELIGISEGEVETIVRFRAEHGPIADGLQLSAVLGGRPMTATSLERADFAPSESTSPEAPGA